MTPDPRPASRPARRFFWLGASSAALGLLLGLWQPLVLVAFGGFGIAAGPSYVGLAFALCLLVAVLSGIIAIFAPASRTTFGSIFGASLLLALGMVAGNVIAASFELSWAASARLFDAGPIGV